MIRLPHLSARASRQVDRALHGAMIVAAAVATVTAAGTAAAFAGGYRWNTTASMPLGLWRVHKTDRIQRGDIVWVCPPNTETFRQARRYGFVPDGYCPGGFNPLLKPIAAVAGDRVEVSSQGIRVNGRMIPRSAPAPKDGHGRLLPRIPHRSFTVRAETVWLVSSYNPASFDSRYFGPVPTSGITGVATPVATREGR